MNKWLGTINIEFRDILGMDDKRRYQRYAVVNDGYLAVEAEIIVGRELAQLENFSLSGLCVLSKIPFSTGVAVGISVDFEDHGKIELMGKIVWVKPVGDMWRVAIDLTETYKPDSLRKV